MVPAAAQVSFGTPASFNDGWLFALGEQTHAEQYTDDSRWQKVDVPHDWSIKGTLSPGNASCTGFLPAGIGWYRKHFDGRTLSAENVYIYFEGVYNRSKVWLNGHLLGERPSGYNSFMYDMTPYLDRNGENVLAVRVDHSMIADSRWYTGSGIYRNVWVIEAGETHFGQWGVTYRTVSMTDKTAVVQVDAEINGMDKAPEGTMFSAIMKDADGNIVAKVSRKAAENLSVVMKVRNPRRWDLDDPYMYTIETALEAKGKVLDHGTMNAGLRTLEFSADKGFALNGRNMKIKGVCLHHDAGALGSAVPDEVLEKRLRQLKGIGANAIRTSHNPQSPAFYDLCDRIGLLVMDEAFDEWEFNKKKWVEGWNVGKPAMDGTADYFNEWGERDVIDMVRRDRNHPCVFLWSIGNEVDYPNDPYSHPILDGGNLEFNQPASGGYRPDAPNAERIGMIAKKLAAAVRSIDTSRPVTGALAGVAMSNQTEYPDVIDVVGYNYSESRYAKDHASYPERILYGSENNGGLREWKAARDNDYIFGQFIWTGADYLGESNEWPSRGFYTGLVDFASNLKPRGHYRKAIWSEEPSCYIGTYPKPVAMAGRTIGDSSDAWDIWNYEDGQIIRVVCYTNAQQARLLLNGKVVGEMTPNNDENGIIGWDVPYSAGSLVAEGYTDGTKVSEYVIRTSLRPYALRASAEPFNLGDAGETAIITVDILDDNGNLVTLGDNEITCITEGPAELLGLEAGDNSDMGDYTDNVQRAFHGHLTAYVRTLSKDGEIKVKFTSPLLKGCELVIR